jgi:hypothetical protein
MANRVRSVALSSLGDAYLRAGIEWVNYNSQIDGAPTILYWQRASTAGCVWSIQQSSDWFSPRKSKLILFLLRGSRLL